MDATVPRSATVAVEQRSGLGDCLVATRELEAGTVIVEETPLLHVSSVHSAGAGWGASVFEGFSSAPVEVQEDVLALFKLALNDPHPMVQDARVEAERYHAKQTRGKYTIETLQKALLVFQLNGYSFEDGRTAVFKVASKFTHSCECNTRYTSTARPGHGTWVALRAVAVGELLTTDYLGRGALMSTPQRRLELYRTKAFWCQCPRCLRPDLARAVPCPACHPKVAGLLPSSIAFPDPDADSRIKYAIPPDGSDAWFCRHCERTWDVDAVFPATDDGSGGAGMRGPELERTVEAGVQRFHLRLLAGEAIEYSQVTNMLGVAGQLLGARHWATAKIMHVQCQCLGPQLAPALQQLPNDKLIMQRHQEMSDTLERLWSFCAHSQVPVSVVWDAFVHGAACMAAASKKSRVRKASRTFMGRVLAGHVFDIAQGDGRSQVAGLLRASAVPSEGAAAAEWLKQAGNEAFSSGRAGEALLYYRAAAFADPCNHKTLSNLSAVLLEVQLPAEAAIAARHCIRRCPEWAKGHYRLAAALRAAGHREQARVAASDAAKLAPDDTAVKDLLTALDDLQL